MKSWRWWQRTLILALLSLSVLAPLFLVSHRLNLTPYARLEFQEDISSVTYRTDPLQLNAIEQEGAEELEEPKEVVYIEKKNGPINSSIQQKVNDSEESKIEGYRNNILERNVSEFNRNKRQDQKAQRKGLFSVVGDENIFNLTVTHNQSMHTHPQKTTDDNVEVTDKQSMPRATQNHQISRPQSRRVSNQKVLEIKDQIIQARAYLGLASPGSSSHLVKELKLRIKEMEHAVGEATMDSDLSRSALQKMRHMAASLSKAVRAYPDCVAMTTKLRAMNHNAEEKIHSEQQEATYLVHLAARTTPKGLHCLSMQLTADYFALRPEDRKLPNENKINDPKLHHYAVFSDNVLACAVVVNSTISNAKKQGKLVFHVVTNSVNLPAIWMWFLLNPPGKATVHVQSIENFEWLLKYNTFKERSSSDPRYTSELNYLRFYLPDIFPTLNKVLLFDHDVVVQQDLSRLWNVNMKEKVIAAVGTCQEGETSFHRMDTFLNFSDPFIANRFDVNACTWAFGMNLFDLQQWRRQNLTALYHSYLQMGFKRQLWSTGSLPLGWLTFYNKSMILDRRWQILGLGYDSNVDKNQIERSTTITMEPEVSIEGSAMIQVAVVPIGTVPSNLLRDYYSMLIPLHTIPLSAISSFYTEHQKSPFAVQPWDSGSLRFKFVLGGAPPSPWEDFQSNRKTLAVVGVVHCPSSPDLDTAVDVFSNACKSFPSSLVDRCFAFCPNDSQLEDGSKKGGNLRLFPPADRPTLEFHLNTMMQEIAASLLMEFEKWVLQAESSGTILKTPLDSQASLSSEEVIKAKKRRLGRAQKTIGDYCLLAGSPVDANAHYSTALELSRLTGDYFWYAGAMEGSVCALLIDRMGQKDSALEEEVRYRYNIVIMNYKKSQDNVQRVSPLTFELEATLKLARFLCRRELAKEVVELLTTAADGAKSLIDASDRLILYIEIARLYGSLGYHRKAAFFSRQVAQLYLQQENRLAAISAMQVLAMTTKAYHVQSRSSLSDHSLHRNGIVSNNADSGKTNHQSAVSLFESQWSTLQMVVLREILLSAVRAGDPLTAWSAAARLLRSYYPLITPAGQNGLANALSNSADRLPLGTRCADPALPFVRLHSFPLHPTQIDIIKRSSAREDWWAGAAPSGPFIYTPFSKGESNNIKKHELIWIVGEPVEVLVELANPCGFDLRVDSIYLSVHSGNFDAFPVSVSLLPNSSKVITLSGIPTSVGPVSIPGCIVHCFGVITEHLFKEVDNLLLGASQGLVLSDPFRCCGSPKLKNVSVPNISVVPPLPLLVSHVVGGDGAIILYEGEIRDVWIRLANAGTVPIEQAHISLSGKNQDSVISYSSETLKSCLPLRPGAEVTFPVTLRAWQVGLVDADAGAGKTVSGNYMRHSKDGISPSLLFHYAGPMKTSEDTPTNGSTVPPGRRLVVPLQICVLQGLSFVKAQLLSMEFPAHVGESLPKLDVNNKSTGEHVDSETKMDRLVKIDPFRGSWGLRFLELELSNPTDVVFEINVSVKLEKSSNENNHFTDQGATEYVYPKTRIDRDCSARVLVPLEHFKLPVLDDSFFIKDTQLDGNGGGRNASFSEKNTKAELNACIKNLISRIKVRWHSGRNSSGELNIKEAIQAALQTSVMDVLLPDPLTFGFRLVRDDSESKKTEPDKESESAVSKGSVIAHEMTPMEVLVRNNTKDMLKMSLNITCRDVAGENCVDGTKATVLWTGVLSDIAMEIPPLQQIKHSFCLHFLVPGEYTLLAAAVIDDANDILRARAKTTSAAEPIFCRGPPYHVRVLGTA